MWTVLQNVLQWEILKISLLQSQFVCLFHAVSNIHNTWKHFMSSWRFLCSKLSIVPFIVLSTALWSSRAGRLMQSFYAHLVIGLVCFFCFQWPFYRSTNQYFALLLSTSCSVVPIFLRVAHCWITDQLTFIVFLWCRTVGAKSLELVPHHFGTVARPLRHAHCGSGCIWGDLNGASSATCDFTSC